MPSTWPGIEPATLGIEGQRYTNLPTRSTICIPCDVSVFHAKDVNYVNSVEYGNAIDQEEKLELVASLAKKKLSIEGCTGRKSEREKSSVQKKISDDKHRPCVASCQKPFAAVGWEILEHPPYSPDLNPCDFDLIPQLKKRFANREDILTAFRRAVVHIDESRTAYGIQRLHQWPSALAEMCKG
ncbi:hypothetical protein ANN_19376 [Periplaneta americana]|uniref:Tc1-like transposase DDE domain-containing protein n=1 Tax=Periplaneta americana TaxID=6978 RepID=A0ABQ8SAM1_PERAM|nr:hypothetical protein ANN_19376 [Periplaneta americana]